MNRGILALVCAILGNIFLAWLFWSAGSPQNLGTLIIPAGPLVLASEFLAIYAGGIISGKRVEPERSFEGRPLPPSPQKRRAALLIAFAIAGLLAGWFLQQSQFAFFFIASLLVKYFGHRAVRHSPMTVIAYIWFLLSLVILIVPESLFENLFWRSNISSELTSRFLSWGIAYFVAFAVMTTVLFFRELGKNSRSGLEEVAPKARP